jgi:hypothetical protein
LLRARLDDKTRIQCWGLSVITWRQKSRVPDFAKFAVVSGCVQCPYFSVCPQFTQLKEVKEYSLNRTFLCHHHLRRLPMISLPALTLMLSAACSVFAVESVEEAPYSSVLKDRAFELRD